MCSHATSDMPSCEYSSKAGKSLGKPFSAWKRKMTEKFHVPCGGIFDAVCTNFVVVASWYTHLSEVRTICRQQRFGFGFYLQEALMSR